MAKERELKVRILGDSSSAERAFKRTSDAADKVGPSGKVAQQALEKVSGTLTSKLGPASGVADDALKKLGGSAISSGSALSLGLAGGAAVAGGALAAFAADGVSAFLDLAEEVRNFQRTSGATTEDSSRFVAVLDDLKISSEAGATALFKLGREVSAGAPKLAEYGIEVERNVDGTANLTETLLNVADAYAKAPDQATKTAIAFAAFGKQAQGLLPLLEKGRKGLAEFFEGAEQHGQILSQEDLDKARELELAIDELQDSMRGLQLVGAKALVPFLTILSDAGAKVVGVVEGIEQKTGGLLTKIGGTALKGAFGPLGVALDILPGKAKKAADSAEEVGDAADAAAGLMGELGDETKDTADAHREAEVAARAHAAALRSVLSASESLIGSQLSVADAVDSLRQSHAESAIKERELAEAIKAHGRGSQEALEAAEAVEDQRRSELRDIDSLAKARRDLAVQQAEAAGQTVTDAAKYDLYRDALIGIKDETAPGSPLRKHLEELIDQLPPPIVQFEVAANTQPALQAVGELAAAIRRDLGNVLVGLLPTPTAPAVSTTVSTTPVRYRAHGGSTTGLTVVGEEGPELLNLGSAPHYVTDADRTAAALGGGGIDYERLAGAIAAAIGPTHSRHVENHFGPIHGLTLAEVEAAAERKARVSSLMGEGA